jgi:uncharacterized zinc-type alcohol dehydrogenase-like protein
MKISAYASFEKGLLLKPFQYHSATLKPTEVLVKVSYCGICHSDLHLIKDDWGANERPLVPGHEAVGEVIQVGKSVRKLKLKQKVGVGWQNSSCGKCQHCKQAKEHLCEKQQATCVGHHGGFANYLMVDQNFAIPIPKNLKIEAVGPLLCGGITVFSPLEKYLKPKKRTAKVAVLGVGGLGHIAIKMACKMGYEVHALSRSKDKLKEVKTWGAKSIITYGEISESSQWQNSFDFILSTVPFDLPWQQILNLMAAEAELCFVGIPTEPIPVPAFNLVVGERKIVGSVIGSPAAIKRMLRFCSKHKIEPQVEVLPLAEVNQAMRRLEQNDVRYRFVLKMP